MITPHAVGTHQIAVTQTTDIDQANGTVNLTMLLVHTRGMDFLRLAPLSTIGDLGTAPDGCGADLRATLPVAPIMPSWSDCGSWIETETGERCVRGADGDL